MSRVGLSKLFRFEAAHHLNNYEGKCARPHGHSYRLRVTVSKQAGMEDKAGILIDFDVIKRAVTEAVVDKYDHQNLNEFFQRPTAEVMVRVMHYDIQKWFTDHGMNVSVDHCRLWETETCYAEYPAMVVAMPSRDDVAEERPYVVDTDVEF